MKTNKLGYISKGSIIFTALFFAFCILFIMECLDATRVVDLGIDTIAPENLKNAPESFRLRLQVESRDFPVEKMMKTESWGQLEKEVLGYAERLELLEKQNRRRRLLGALVYLISALGMAAFSGLVRKHNRNEGQEPIAAD